MKLVTLLIGLVFSFSVQANEPPAAPSADAPAVHESAGQETASQVLVVPAKEMKKAGKKAAKKKKKHKKNEENH